MDAARIGQGAGSRTRIVQLTAAALVAALVAGCRGRGGLDLLATLDAADPVFGARVIDVGADVPSDAVAFGEGWSLRERGWGLTFAWAAAPHATLRFFSLGGDTRVVFRALGHSVEGGDPQRVRVSVNGTFVGERDLPAVWNDYTLSIPAQAVRRGSNELALDFAWVRAGGPDDPRTLAAAFDKVTVGPDDGQSAGPPQLPSAWRRPDGNISLPPHAGLHLVVDLGTDAQLALEIPCIGSNAVRGREVAVWVGAPDGTTEPQEVVRRLACVLPGTTGYVTTALRQPGVRDLYVVNTSASGALVLSGLTLQRHAPAPRAAKPNLLLVVLDALRADHLGSHGYGRSTSPCIDDLARRSTQFTRAFAQAPMTITSMASLFTGMYPPFHGATDRAPLGESLPVWPALLAESGYATVAISANPFVGHAFGLTRGFHDVFELFASTPRLQRGLEGVVRPQTLLATATRWLSEPHDQPFFMLLHFLQPHTPYAPPKPYRGTFGDDDHCFDGGFETLSSAFRQSYAAAEELRQPAIDRYDDNIRYVDAAICRLEQQLELLDLTRRTALVLTADHGEQFLDHGGFFHTPGSMFDELLHVPLIVALPGAAPAQRSEQVESVDIGPTMLELAGIDTPFGQGHSLLGADGRAGDQPVFAFSHREDWRTDAGVFSAQSVRTSRYKLIRHLPEQPVELYDLAADPRELDNSAPQNPEHVAELIALIEARLADGVPHAAPAAAPAAIDASTRERLRALGYHD